VKCRQTKAAPPTGSGDPAVFRFLTEVVSEAGGAISADAQCFVLSVPSEARTIAIRHRPTTPSEWRVRLGWVEKLAANHLLNAPVLFEADWGRGKNDGRQVILRLSFGLLLSLGDPCPVRYSASALKASRAVTVTEAADIPTHGADRPIKSLPGWAVRRLEDLCDAVLKTCAEYSKRSDVSSAIEAVTSARRRELGDIDRLYSAEANKNPTLLGVEEPDTSGSEAVEAERRRLQQVVLERYSVRIVVKTLSLGVLVGMQPVPRPRRPSRKTSPSRRQNPLITTPKRRSS
jgi:hypothetical protein